MNFLKKEIDFWEKHTEEYESLNEEDYKKIFNFLPAKEYKMILEIGCASGPFSTRFKKKYKNTIIYGIDISLNLLKKYKFYGVKGDGCFLPFKSASFDLIIFSASLHHIHRVNKVMKDVKRILKKTGTIFMYEPNIFHPYRFLITNNFLFDGILNPTGERALNPFKLKKNLNRLNFVNIKINFITFKYNNPGLLGIINYKISTFAEKIKCNLFFIHPWFIMVYQKNE